MIEFDALIIWLSLVLLVVQILQILEKIVFEFISRKCLKLTQPNYWSIWSIWYGTGSPGLTRTKYNNTIFWSNEIGQFYIDQDSFSKVESFYYKTGTITFVPDQFVLHWDSYCYLRAEAAEVDQIEFSWLIWDSLVGSDWLICCIIRISDRRNLIGQARSRF